MKKMLIIIITIMITLFLSGCTESIDYKKMYLNNEIDVEEELPLYKHKELVESVQKSLEDLKNVDRFELKLTAKKNDYRFYELHIKCDRSKRVFFKEEVNGYYEDHKEIYNQYIIGGYSYQYESIFEHNYQYPIRTRKTKIDYEEVIFDDLIEKFLPTIDIKDVYSEKLANSGRYRCGEDKYGNMVIMYSNKTNSIGKYIDFVPIIVLKDDRPIFFIGKNNRYNEIYYEYKYDDIKIKMPDFKDYGKEEW